MSTTTGDDAQLLELYRTMTLIREFERTVERLHLRGRLRGSFHSAIGQESPAAGVCAALDDDDVVTSTHRGHGHALARRVPAAAIMAELFARADGTSKGRGGSMHLHHRPTRFLGTNAIVAGGLPWAAGAAWARRRQGRPGIGVGFLGDGAVGQGLFYETLRLASLWSSPCLFVCENNGLAHSMPASEVAGEPGSIARIAESMGLHATYVDGADVCEVHTVAEQLVRKVREGQPAFLECKVFRVRPHSLSDPDHRYREKDAGARWLDEHDPIERLRGRLGTAHHARLAELDREVADVIDDAVATAESAPAPDPRTAAADVGGWG